jgi:hypothetical protein
VLDLDVPATAPRGTVARMTDDSSSEPDGVLNAAQQDPTEQENLGAGPARTDPPGGQGSGVVDPDDVPDAPAGPGATPADPDEPLNPA